MDPVKSPLLTDLYQLTMLDVYFQRDMQATAVFEFFVRRLPQQRNFLVAAGLEQVLGFLEGLAFSDAELDWLRDSNRFSERFLDQIAQLRFTGDVHAMPEGSVFFAQEPILRVTAPLPQAQLVESRIINLLNFQCMIASKAARCVLAAPNKSLIDFGMRRAHGAEAALLSGRANYLAGFTGTATVLSGAHFDIPVFGTMAHSFIQANENEAQAFEDFARAFVDNAVLLIDTYDTAAASSKVVALADRLKAQGITISAVRIDSGDLGAEARRVREILDAGNHPEIGIFVSGNLDEHRVQQLVDERTPIDGFGIGTSLDVSDDAPSLDCVYKLQEYAGRPRRKRSQGKATWPGRKQVYRRSDNGLMQADIVTLEDHPETGDALLKQVMRKGKRLNGPAPLEAIRERLAAGLASLPPALRELAPAKPYPVEISSSLSRLADELDREND